MSTINIKNLQYKKIIKPSILGRTISAKSIISTTYDSKNNRKTNINNNNLINIEKNKDDKGNKEIKKYRASSTVIPSREIISRYPQFFNNRTRNEDGASMDQISWIINLREYNNKKIIAKNNNNILEPSFYRDDLNSYIRKKMKKSKSAIDVENVPIFHKISFLFKKKISDMHGTVINKGLLNYQLNLRNDIKEKNNWNTSTVIKYENFFNKNKEMFKKRIHKNNSENTKKTLKRYGSGITPYNDKYIERNY